MRPSRVPVAVLAMVVACGARETGSAAPDAAPPAQTLLYQSGSRLRAHVWDAGGGATSFIDWRDSKLGIACNFAQDGQGTLRCFPSSSATIAMFLDASCEQHVVLADSTPAPYEATPDPACPDDLPVVHVTGIAWTRSDVTSVFAQQGGACTPWPVPAGQAVFVPGPSQPTDVTTFVAAKVQVESRGAGLDVRVLVADDGARQVVRTLDHARSAPCTATFADDGAGPGLCLPSNEPALVGSAFLDPACTNAVDGAWFCTLGAVCPAPARELRVTGGTCTTLGAYSEVALGAQAAASVFDNGGSGTATCEPSSLSSACSFYPSMQGVTGSAFPAVTSGRIGTGRLTLPVTEAPPDGTVLTATPGGFWDGSRGTHCTLTPFADGISRCVTEDASFVNAGFTFYADPACTQRLIEQIPASTCGTNRAIAYGLVFHDGASAIVDQVFAAGAVFVPTTPDAAATPALIYESTAPGGCTAQAVGNGGPFDGYTFYTLGNAVDPDSAFARVTERTE